MVFNWVKIFVAVAQAKSFSKAAELLFISQPTVTSNIKKLEDELGIVLFHRSNKNVTLTEGGAIFYPYAAELINVYENAEHSLTGYKKSVEGRLEVYASTIPEQYLLPFAVKAFKERFPLVDITIRHYASERVLEKVLGGFINIGFVGAKRPCDSLEYIDFYYDRLVLITPSDKVLPKNPIHITELVGEDIILREEGSGTKSLFENALRKNKLNMTMFGSQITVESLAAIKKMVALGLGISFVPYIAIQDEIKSGQLKMYEIDDLNLERNYSLVCTKNRHLSPVEKKFKDFISSRQWQ